MLIANAIFNLLFEIAFQLFLLFAISAIDFEGRIRDRAKVVLGLKGLGL